MIAALPTQEQVDQIAGTLAPDVVSIRFNVAHDWSGDPAIYFRVVVSDEASRREHLAEVTGRVRQALFDGLGLADGLAELDHLSHFHFRSLTENARLEDKAWD
jgi:hypothetical protein